MKDKSVKNAELYEYLVKTFSEEFADAVTKYMNTDYTVRRMMGYIREVRPTSMELVVDEMLAILNDRDIYVNKLRKGVSKPKWSYFLREESFYNVASALMRKYNDDVPG